MEKFKAQVRNASAQLNTEDHETCQKVIQFSAFGQKMNKILVYDVVYFVGLLKSRGDVEGIFVDTNLIV